jgi:hypothetical protein
MMRKEATVVSFEVLARISLEGLRKTTKCSLRIVGLLVEVLTQDPLPHHNTNKKC